MLKKITHTLYYILFFVAPLIMSSQTTEIFEFNKMLLIYLMALLIGGVGIIRFLLQKNKRISLSPFHLALIVFSITQGLSTLFSIDKHTAIFGYYGRFNGGLLSIIAYSVLFFVFISEKSLSFFKKLLFISLLSSVFVILWGLPGKFNFDLSCGVFTGVYSNSCWTNQFHPDERMFSTLGQPNWLGAYLAIHFFIGIYFFIRETIKKKEIKNLLFQLSFGGYLILNFTTLLFTRSRSSLVSVMVGLIVFPVLLYFSKRSTFKVPTLKKYAVLVLLLVVPILLFKTGIDKVDRYLPAMYSPKSETKVSIKPQKAHPTPQQKINVTDSLDIRKIVWKGGWDLAKQHPLFGTGVETFAYAYYFTRPIEHNATSEWDFLYNKAHNEFINYLATTGFVGFTAYTAMIGMVFFLFIKKYIQYDSVKNISEDKQFDYSLLILSVFVAYSTILITNFFGFSTTTVNLTFYVFPAVFLLRPSDDGEVYPDSGTNIFKQLGIFATGILVAVGIIFIISYWTADVNYSKAENNFRSGQYSQAASKIIDILKYHYEHVYEDKLSLAVVGAALNDTKKDEVKKLLVLAELYNEKAITASPYNMLYWKSRGTILFNDYQINSDKKYLVNAIEAVQTAERLAPTDPRVPYSVAQYAVQMYAEEKDKKDTYKTLALKELDRALFLKSDYIDALTLKADFLKKVGKKREALELYKLILAKYDPTNEDVKKTIEELSN